MSFVLATPPALTPVSLSEAKAHMRVMIDDDDSYIESLIAAATEHTEQFCARAIITQTWDLVLDAFPGCSLTADPWEIAADRWSHKQRRLHRAISLGKGRLQSVGSVKYVDPDGAEQTLSSSSYVVDTAREPGRVALLPGQYWPATRDQANAVTVRFNAGYGTEPNVPADLKQAILLLASHWYENREMVIASNVIISPVPFTYAQLVAKYRVY